MILKARDTWPRTAKIYCHRVDVWPDEVEILERVPTRSCVRRGAAIDLVLDRARENRSQLVITTVRGGRQAIFWQTARTVKQARPGVRVPGARAGGLPDLEIVVDSHERYAYTFADRRVTVTKAALPTGDYGVVQDGSLLATVERKSLADLVGTLTSGRLKYQLADLAAVPQAAVVVEDRFSSVFKLDRVRPAVVADGLAECQVRWPTVPIVFCETRTLAQEWAYRFPAAAWVGAAESPSATRPSPPGPTPGRWRRPHPRPPRCAPGRWRTGGWCRTGAGSGPRSWRRTSPPATAERRSREQDRSSACVRRLGGGRASRSGHLGGGLPVDGLGEALHDEPQGHRHLLHGERDDQQVEGRLAGVQRLDHHQQAGGEHQQDADQPHTDSQRGTSR
ncbi:MAG: ERCC4 domain-containing protein [Nocardioides sp.]